MTLNGKNRLEGSLAFLNTALFALAACVLAYGLYVSIFDWETFTTKTGGSFAFGEKLMLFALGVRMTGVDLSDWRIGLAGALICPLTGLLMAWLVGLMVPLPQLQLAQLIVFAALPPAVLNFMLAERYGIEPRKVAAVVLMGNMMSLLVLPAVLLFVL